MPRSSVPAAFIAAIMLAAALAACGEKGKGPPAGAAPPKAAAPAPAAAPEGPPVFLMIAAGRSATCGVTASGAMYCWGRNALGQLGDGTTLDRTRPVRVGADTIKWKMVAPGGSHTCAITMQGATYCWGSGLEDEIGNDTISESPLPVKVVGIPPMVEIASGDNHSCALSDAGALWCWGDNRHGELGKGDTTAVRHPMAVAPQTIFRTIAVTSHATCGLTPEGKLYCWGLDNGGALGFTAGTACDEPPGVPNRCETTPRRTAESLVFSQAALGYEHGCGVGPGGAAHCWGSNGAGELGTGTRDSAGPKSVAGELRFATMAAGGAFTCGVTTTGELYCWGTNADGQVAGGAGADEPLPGAVAPGTKFLSVTAGHDHACALTVDRQVMCWGSNLQGQLGTEVNLRSFVPVTVTIP